MGALPGVELCFPALRVAKFIGSSKARWFEERFFPLTPALSPLVPHGEREKRKRRVRPLPLSPILRTPFCALRHRPTFD